MLAFIRQATSCVNKKNLKFDQIKINKKEFEWVQASSPARLDLAGAWSDTPPITYECEGGSCVTNVAILVNGKKPIGARARVLNDDQQVNSNILVRIIMQEDEFDSLPDATAVFEFSSLDDFKDYNKPQAVACLMKAVLVYTKLIELNDQKDLSEQLKSKLGGSLEIRTWTGLPQGSGLGTSSILIACVLKVVWYLMGINVNNETLSYSILLVEQLMTTNGGWQDQVGGIWGGFKLTRADNKLPMVIRVEQLSLDDEFLEEELNSRLVLIYTGITRLAKDLLLNVLRNWYAISAEIYDNVQELVKNGLKCAKALEESIFCEINFF
jgi:fucokinase